jgi:glutamate/tyrosine decarboxylase-like PLP-dependent enzyme
MSIGFDLDHRTREQLGQLVMTRLNDYFSTLRDRAVQLPAEQRSFPYVPEPIPEEGKDAELVFEEVFHELLDRGFHITSANYLGLMNPTPTFISVLADAIVSAFNPQLASVERSAAASLIERQTSEWIGQRVGWQAGFAGVFTTGGSEANLTALNLALVKLDPRVIDEGLQCVGAPLVFYASEESHHSLDKAAGTLGLGRQALRRVRVDANLRMDTVELEQAICADIDKGNVPFCVVGTAGTTNTGAIDDLVSIAEIARRHKLWFHVDGAYGGAVVFSDLHRHLVLGVELAESVAIDPHKWLAMPFAAGILVTRHPELLGKTYGTAAPYLCRSTNAALEDLFQTSSQWSRRMNSLKLWMTLRVHGRQSYEQMINEQIRLAAKLAKWVTECGHFELCAPQTLSGVAFRVKLPTEATEQKIAAANAAVVEGVNWSGERWISLTTVAGRSAIRVMIISYLTSEEHILALQQALLKVTGTVITALEPRCMAAGK